MRQIFRNEKDIIVKLPTKRLQTDQMQRGGFAPRQAACLTSNLLGVGRGNLTSLRQKCSKCQNFVFLSETFLKSNLLERIKTSQGRC